MKKWCNTKFFYSLIGLFLLSSYLCAQPLETIYNVDRAKLISEQIDLLKNRVAQADVELVKLQKYQKKELLKLTVNKVNKQLLSQTRLEISVAKSDLDSISIELTESQQTINRLEKNIQEIENQLNVVGIFGGKIIHMSKFDVNSLQGELSYQQEILKLEKQRTKYLGILQMIADKVFQLYKIKFTRLDELLKSQTIMQLKEQQAQSELSFQQQQMQWFLRLNQLNSQLAKLQLDKNSDKTIYRNLEADIFYVNENVNFSYLQMLVARYQDQLEQLRVSVSQGGSITLLNKISDQAQSLSKQLIRVGDLLKARMTILENRKQLQSSAQQQGTNYINQLQKLFEQYQMAFANVGKLNQEITGLHNVLDKALQQELSSRQKLPGFEPAAWLNMGAEILLLPSLAFHVVKSLVHSFSQTILEMNDIKWVFIAILEVLWLSAFYYINRFSVKRLSQLTDIEFGHVNLKWLSFKLLKRHVADIAILGNIMWLFYVCNVPQQSFTFVLDLALVWLFFKAMITLARLYLVETVHDRAGVDVRLYYRLRWTFIVGGIVTVFAVFVQKLPVSYEVKDLFSRLFLLFLLGISLVLLRSWEVIPGLIIPHLDERKNYLNKVVRLLGVLVPLLFIINSTVGLLGYVNLVYTISWYQGIFLLVMAAYLVARGLLIETMEFFSTLLIRHVNNGWLWTEAFLKPIDRVLRIALFLVAWAMLFLMYGWDRQSPVVERMHKLTHYKLGEVLNTPITPLSAIELVVIISLLYWAAKWTREFVYRLLLPRTQDMGIRNSIAILSQYAMIIVGILIGLRVLGIDFKALAVVAGMFAFGVGLGLRDLANNFASGFLLLIERPIKVGDIVTINDHEGDVVHIGGRAVTVRTWDHIDVVVPNSEIFSKTFLNWTSKDSIVRTVTKIQIDRHENALLVQGLIYEILFQNKNVLKDPVPEVYLSEILDGVIDIEVRYFINIRLVRSRIEIRSEILLAIWEMFERKGIQSPYPTRELYVHQSAQENWLPKFKKSEEETSFPMI